MKKQRSCIRMDNLNTEQKKELNSRIKHVVQDFNEEVENSKQELDEEKSEE